MFHKVILFVIGLLISFSFVSEVSASFITDEASYININTTYYNLSLSKTGDRIGRIYSFYPMGTNFDFSTEIPNGILQNEYQNFSSTSFTSLQNQHPVISILYNDTNTAFIRIDTGMPGDGVNITEYFIFWKGLPYFYHVNKRFYLRDEALEKNNDYDILWYGNVFDEVSSENITGGLQTINISTNPTAAWQYLRVEPKDLEYIKNKFAWYNYRNIHRNISLGGILLKQNPLFNGHGINFNIGLRNISINPKSLPYNENELTGFFKKPGHTNLSDSNYNYDLYEMLFYVNKTNDFIRSDASSLFSTIHANFTENYYYVFKANSDYYIRAPGIFADNTPDVNSYDSNFAYGSENDITTLFKSWQIDIDGKKDVNVYNHSSSKIIGQNNDTLTWINDWSDYIATITMTVNSTNTVKYTFNLTSKKNGLIYSNYKVRFYRDVGIINLNYANATNVLSFKNMDTNGNNIVLVKATPLDWVSFEYNVSRQPFQAIFTPEKSTNSSILRTANHIEYWMYPYNSQHILNKGQSDIKNLYVTMAYNTSVNQIPVKSSAYKYASYYYQYPNHPNFIFERFDENFIPLQTTNTFLINKTYIVNFSSASGKVALKSVGGRGIINFKIGNESTGNIQAISIVNSVPGYKYTLENMSSSKVIESYIAQPSITFNTDIGPGTYLITSELPTIMPIPQTLIINMLLLIVIVLLILFSLLFVLHKINRNNI